MITKSMWWRWVEILLYMKKNRTAYRVLVGNQKARNCLEDLGIDGSIILKHLKEAV
jgi:hypothetical protein